MGVLAVLCSDLHFSHNAPTARSAEPSWYVAMERAWYQVRVAAQDFKCPIVIAGDIFDNWRSPPELITFAIKLFRGWDVYTIPGQHDLPNHVYQDAYRSAYGTLIEAGAVKDIPAGECWNLDGLALWSFPWGFEIEPVCMPNPEYIHLAVVHRYIWVNNCKYPGAPEEAKVGVFKKQLEGYNAAVFGDNHKGFLAVAGKCEVLNCGGLMSRKSDERNYQPHYGLLFDDGTIERVPLDISQDKWVDPEDVTALVDESLNMGGLISELEHLGGDTLNFIEVLTRYVEKNKISPEVGRLIADALDKGRGHAT